MYPEIMNSIMGEVERRKKAENENGSENPIYSERDTDLGITNEELIKIMESLTTRILVVGCGGGGSNTIKRIVNAGITGAVPIAMNTDVQHLVSIPAPYKLLIGRHTTRGLGSGAIPKVGEQATLEAEEEIKSLLKNSDLVFVTCGLGGGTGTGGAPVIARIAKEIGALVIAVVTFPFTVEGTVRAVNAQLGLEKLKNVADTVIVIPNDKLLSVVPRLSLSSAFKVADEVLMRAIKGITEMITIPGMINLDFADLKRIMSGENRGMAMIGLGEAEGNDTSKAVYDALHSPLLDVDITNATGALINVIGSPSMTLIEVQQAVGEIKKKLSYEATIIEGCGVRNDKTNVEVMTVITGVQSQQIFGPKKKEKLKDVGLEIIK